MPWKKLLPLLICILGELLLQTSLRNQFGPFITPVLHTIFSLGSGIGLLVLGWNFTGSLNEAKVGRVSQKKIISWSWVLLLPLIWWMFSILNGYFEAAPIDINDDNTSGSDVIPALMFYVTRFVNGAYPYTPIHGTHWAHTVVPNYLPMHWLPYSFDEWLGIDYRWIPALALLAIFMVYYRKLMRVTISRFSFGLLWLLPVVLLFFYHRDNEADLQVTVEGLMAAFYLLVGFALIKGKLRWIATAVVLCLLSRFSLVLWLPLFLLIILANRGFKTALYFGLALCGGFLLVYGPFLIKDPHIFTKGLDYYTLAAGGEWTIKSWQYGENALYPYHLDKGMGFAIYFYKYATGDYLQKLEAARQAHLWVTLVTTAILALVFWCNRKKVHPMVFALASLKIYLAVFYSLIQVPYFYLYTVPLLVNVPLMWMATKIVDRKQQMTPYP